MNSINDLLNQKADDLFMNTDDIVTDNMNTVNDDNTTDVKEEPKTEEPVDWQALKTTIYQIKDQLDSVLRLINKNLPTSNKNTGDKIVLDSGEAIIEGVFNGEKMVGPDGKEYSIPPNYASKSKLVEGDIMKLTITKNGSFIFKQIGPIARKQIVGELVANADETWAVLANGKTYKVLTASITFYKGQSGNEVAILLPEEGESDWAAVDNVIKK
ncbi:MAG: 50S ribosomal protein L7/L12 [Candidatus Magasanikbacteria bacterium GW2011_GWC2_37_14]|uniref:50S ribosomal protein L7/L12 n=1 Tax=Candidatus Magasanikbacteria bacterium GW2011_GWC2_37_14 TaxID=1619046 RepID=A0A0G0ITF1_9BACT|nr:MAG: 50S ribosomal protein L7/L12 [Candidatus Magasanikbacteria bacterium GW2011_GWC2_37_14]